MCFRCTLSAPYFSDQPLVEYALGRASSNSWWEAGSTKTTAFGHGECDLPGFRDGDHLPMQYSFDCERKYRRPSIGDSVERNFSERSASIELVAIT